MGYFVRSFCKSPTKPTVKQIIDHINGLNLGLTVSTNLNPEELVSNTWSAFELNYKLGKLPILVECNTVADNDGLARDDIKELIDEIGNPGLIGKNKKKVIAHLQDTKYIICNQLLTSDMDDSGFNVNGEFLKYFVNHHAGMIYADDEGFYEGEKLIVKLE